MSRLELRDPRSPDGVTGDPCGALKIESTWMDEHGVGQVRGIDVSKALRRLDTRRYRGDRVEAK